MTEAGGKEARLHAPEEIDVMLGGISVKTLNDLAGDPWHADPGDVITHVNGYAVKTLPELTCAVNAAEDKDDLQLVIKDVDTGKQYVFYVTAAKR